jgi:hypothetical protein
MNVIKKDMIIKWEIYLSFEAQINLVNPVVARNIPLLIIKFQNTARIIVKYEK